MVLKRMLGGSLLFSGVVAAAACGSKFEGAGGQGVVDASSDQVAPSPDADVTDGSMSSDATASSDADASSDAVSDAPPPDAACNVVVATPPIETATHVPEGTAITYSTNPPSSGPHYPIWANFIEYDHPVADGYMVHSMEHGAVVLFYDCDANACTPPAGVVEALRAVRDAATTDPLCDPAIRVRIIIAPRPDNDVAIEAAAWGATYRADCVDAPTLSQFIADHYAKGPENFCSPGQNL